MADYFTGGGNSIAHKYTRKLFSNILFPETVTLLRDVRDRVCFVQFYGAPSLLIDKLRDCPALLIVLNITCLQRHTMFNRKLLYIFILNEYTEVIVISNDDETTFFFIVM